jgi:hypothetical protein
MDIGGERGGDERCSRREDGRLSTRQCDEAPYHRVRGTNTCRQSIDWPGWLSTDDITLLGLLFISVAASQSRITKDAKSGHQYQAFPRLRSIDGESTNSRPIAAPQSRSCACEGTVSGGIVQCCIRRAADELREGLSATPNPMRLDWTGNTTRSQVPYLG